MNSADFYPEILALLEKRSMRARIDDELVTVREFANPEPRFVNFSVSHIVVPQVPEPGFPGAHCTIIVPRQIGLIRYCLF